MQRLTGFLEFISSTKFYGVNGLCFPLHIDDPFLLGWQFSAFIFFGINATSLLVILTVYSIMFASIWKTRHATSLPLKDFEFAVRFFFIVLTDTGCWLPIILLKIFAFMDIEISVDVYAWLVVFVLPVNSAVNPMLYTLTTPKYRNKIYRANVTLKCLKYFPKSGDFKLPLRGPSSHSTVVDTRSGPVTRRNSKSFRLVLNNC